MAKNFLDYLSSHQKKRHASTTGRPIANDGLRREKTAAAKRGYAKAQLRRSPFMIERFWEVTK